MDWVFSLNAVVKYGAQGSLLFFFFFRTTVSRPPHLVETNACSASAHQNRLRAPSIMYGASFDPRAGRVNAISNASFLARVQMRHWTRALGLTFFFPGPTNATAKAEFQSWFTWLSSRQGSSKACCGSAHTHPMDCSPVDTARHSIRGQIIGELNHGSFNRLSEHFQSKNASFPPQRNAYSARHDIAVPLLAVNPSKLSNLYYISNNVGVDPEAPGNIHKDSKEDILCFASPPGRLPVSQEEQWRKNHIAVKNTSREVMVGTVQIATFGINRKTCGGSYSGLNPGVVKTRAPRDETVPRRCIERLSKRGGREGGESEERMGRARRGWGERGEDGESEERRVREERRGGAGRGGRRDLTWGNIDGVFTTRRTCNLEGLEVLRIENWTLKVLEAKFGGASSALEDETAAILPTRPEVARVGIARCDQQRAGQGKVAPRDVDVEQSKGETLRTRSGWWCARTTARGDGDASKSFKSTPYGAFVGVR
ncbi:hypothetical protein C8R46DRAFT_1027521 [Mycena filopes]|nr:hypothetical protein C8R46DRAFT_1027521 [Mycena filopes]